MISDIVLSGDLPDAVAVPGRLCRMHRRGDPGGGIPPPYGSSGVPDVHVVQVSRFEIAETVIDAYTRSIAGNFNVPPEAVREAARSILSVQVFGRKPA